MYRRLSVARSLLTGRLVLEPAMAAAAADAITSHVMRREAGLGHAPLSGRGHLMSLLHHLTFPKVHAKQWWRNVADPRIIVSVMI